MLEGEKSERTEASDSCSSFLANIRNIPPYLHAGWSLSGLDNTSVAQTWSTVSLVLSRQP